MFKLTSADYEHELELDAIDSGARFGESWLWVQHTLGADTWQACYERDDEGFWHFYDGEFRPDLPREIALKFEGAEGDAILDRLFEKNDLTKHNNIVNYIKP